MSTYRSGFADDLHNFVNYRKASGAWNDACYGLQLMYFDRFCADNYPPNTQLSQEMVDTWCAKRDGELNRTCNTRTRPIRTFIRYLQNRGLTDVSAPPVLNSEPKTYIPHAFTSDEIKRFFCECDNIKARKKPFRRTLQKIDLSCLLSAAL